MPGSSAVSPPRIAQPAARQTAAAPSYQLRHLLDVDRVGGDVVEEEERLGTGRQDVVDAVRSEIFAAPAQAVAAPSQHELGADGIGRRGEHAAVVDRKEACERTEGTDDARGCRRGDGAAKPIDDRVRRGKRHPRGGVRLLGRGHETEPSDPLGSGHRCGTIGT